MESDEWCFSAPQFYDFTLPDSEQEQGFLSDDYFDPNRIENWGGFDQSPVRVALPADECSQTPAHDAGQPTAQAGGSPPSATSTRAAPALSSSPSRVPKSGSVSPVSPHLPLADVLYLPIGDGSTEAKSPTRPIIADPAPVRAVSIDSITDLPLEALLRCASNDEGDRAEPSGYRVGDLSPRLGGSTHTARASNASGTGAPGPSPPATRLSAPLLGVGASGRLSAFSSRDFLCGGSGASFPPPVFVSRLSSGAAPSPSPAVPPEAVAGAPGTPSLDLERSPPSAAPIADPTEKEEEQKEGRGVGATAPTAPNPSADATEAAAAAEPLSASEASFTRAPSVSPSRPSSEFLTERAAAAAVTPRRARVWVSPACSAAKPTQQKLLRSAQFAAPGRLVASPPPSVAAVTKTPGSSPAPSVSVMHFGAAARFSSAKRTGESRSQPLFRTPNAVTAAPLCTPTEGRSPAVATPLQARHLQPAAVLTASPSRTVVKRAADPAPVSGAPAAVAGPSGVSGAVAAKPRKGGGMLKLAANVLGPRKAMGMGANETAVAAASGIRPASSNEGAGAALAEPVASNTLAASAETDAASSAGACLPFSETVMTADEATAPVGVHGDSANTAQPASQTPVRIIPHEEAAEAPTDALHFAALTEDGVFANADEASIAPTAAGALATSAVSPAPTPEPSMVHSAADAVEASAVAHATSQQPRSLAALAARIGRGDAAPKRAAQRVPLAAASTTTAGTATGGVSKLRALAAKSVMSFTSKLPPRVAAVAAAATAASTSTSSTVAAQAAVTDAESGGSHAATSKAPLRVACASHPPPAVAAGGIFLAPKPSATVPQPFKFSTAERAKQHVHATHGAEENTALGTAEAAAAAAIIALARPARRASSQAAHPDARLCPASAVVPAAAEHAPPQPPSRAASATAIYGRHGSRLLYLQRLQQQAAAAAMGRAEVSIAPASVPGDAASVHSPKRARGSRQSTTLVATAAAGGDALDALTPPRRESHAPAPSATPLLSVEERARHRAALEAARAARLEEAAAAAAAASEARRAAEEAELRHLREARAFKARPLDPRIFEAPPSAAVGAGRAPRAHSKPATVARSPSLATKARSRRVSSVAPPAPPGPLAGAAAAPVDEAVLPALPTAAAVADVEAAPSVPQPLPGATSAASSGISAAAAAATMGAKAAAAVERGPGLSARKANVPTASAAAGAKAAASTLHPKRAVPGASGSQAALPVAANLL